MKYFTFAVFNETSPNKRNRPECSNAARRRPNRTHKTEQNGKAARRACYSETDVLHLNHRQGRKPQPLKRQKANEQTATTQRAKAHTAKPPRFLASTHPPHAPALTADQINIDNTHTQNLKTMNTHNKTTDTTTPPGTIAGAFVAPKRRSRITAEQFETINGILVDLDLEAAEGLMDFADSVEGERKAEFFGNLAAFFAGIQTIKDNDERAAAALGLQEGAKLLYLLECYESIILAAAWFFAEVDAARMDKYREAAAREAWEKENA